MTWSVIEGDCVDAMRAMDEASVDAVVCDPPYGISFMGKEWDSSFEPADVPMRRHGAQDAVNAGAAPQGGRQRAGVDFQRRMARDSRDFQAWCEAWAVEALRVLKPGGHLLAFGGTRTYHRLTCALEDAGFEIRDCIMWLYGSGFPKSLDVSKAIASGGGRPEDIRRLAMGEEYEPSGRGRVNYDHGAGSAMNGDSRPVPLTPDAERWQGWSTALKPAHEPVVMARKPLAGTVAATVLAHGTGALNVDGCRITATDPQLAEKYASVRNAGPRENAIYGTDDRERAEGRLEPHAAGRWPANVVLDPEAAAMLDAQTGERPSTGTPDRPARPGSTPTGGYGEWAGAGVQGPLYSDTGGASRFFYCAKASSAERNAGLDGFEPAVTHDGRDVSIDNPYLRGETTRRNVHPTVKPIDVMRWLCRLVTPPGGLVLDPFTGSGTTGCAAVLEGFRFLGIEREPEYAAIARARIGWWAARSVGISTEAALRAGGYGDLMESVGQGDLFGDAA